MIGGEGAGRRRQSYQHEHEHELFVMDGAAFTVDTKRSIERFA